MDDALLQATDEALLRTKQNRSEFVRDALREGLDRLETLGEEAADRAGYERVPSQRRTIRCLGEGSLMAGDGTARVSVWERR
jgi:metal-responsive CopG/Arc/MetJ family transcriptional regulator